MTQADTFEGVIRWLKQIKECKDCPIIILGNKCDLAELICVTKEDLDEVAQQWEIECFETSAITSFNVERAFLTIIQLAYNYKLKDSTGQINPLMLKD